MNLDNCTKCVSTPGHCHWCGKKLRGRQRDWCSKKCYWAFRANHRWTQAKTEVKKEAAYYLCANATEVEPHKGGQWGFTMKVRGPAGCLGFTRRPEVNHIEPCLGKHATFGCHHHQENLEVLCRPCHLNTTDLQRKEGKF